MVYDKVVFCSGVTSVLAGSPADERTLRIDLMAFHQCFVMHSKALCACVHNVIRSPLKFEHPPVLSALRSCGRHRANTKNKLGLEGAPGYTQVGTHNTDRWLDADS